MQSAGQIDTTLSLIIPTLNEEEHIDALVRELISHNDPTVEILFVDGGSTDGTKKRVRHYADLGYPVSLVDNDRKFVNFGFNKAYPLARGRYVGLLGAHAIYPREFCQSAIDYLDKDEADAIGGPLRQVGKGVRGRAIAYCMSARFGVGQTDFRTSKEKKLVDTVAFAVYKRQVVDAVGLLDEELVRNQDDEFHYRINRQGYRILMVPEMEVTYFVRESLKDLLLQYFRYGYFKPLVLRKVRSGMRIKHLIPSVFVLYLLTLPLALFLPIWCLGLICYLCLDVFFSWRCQDRPTVRALCSVVFPLIHISYGTGFLLGLRQLLVGSSVKPNKAEAISGH